MKAIGCFLLMIAGACVIARAYGDCFAANALGAVGLLGLVVSCLTLGDPDRRW